jgi:hypothetical protein
MPENDSIRINPRSTAHARRFEWYAMACALCHYHEFQVDRLEKLYQEAFTATARDIKGGKTARYQSLLDEEGNARIELDHARAELTRHRARHQL